MQLYVMYSNILSVLPAATPWARSKQCPYYSGPPETVVRTRGWLTAESVAESASLKHTYMSGIIVHVSL